MTLSEICRVAILRLTSSVATLPLPLPLRNYLLDGLSDDDDEEEVPDLE